MMTKIQSDTEKLYFLARIKPVVYGDNKTFFEYRIEIFKGAQLVGIERGPRRETQARGDSLKAAHARIATLRSHRLFAVRVTRKNISDGDARNCSSCAIAQALWKNQERMGFNKHDFAFDVSPYGAWVEPRGIVLRKVYGYDLMRLPADRLPDIAIEGRDGKAYSESMFEWAMRWDDWAESRGISVREWREERGLDSDERPSRPSPVSFVLDLDAMLLVQEGAE